MVFTDAFCGNWNILGAVIPVLNTNPRFLDCFVLYCIVFWKKRSSILAKKRRKKRFYTSRRKNYLKQINNTKEKNLMISLTFIKKRLFSSLTLGTCCLGCFIHYCTYIFFIVTGGRYCPLYNNIRVEKKVEDTWTFLPFKAEFFSSYIRAFSPEK